MKFQIQQLHIAEGLRRSYNDSGSVMSAISCQYVQVQVTSWPWENIESALNIAD